MGLIRYKSRAECKDDNGRSWLVHEAEKDGPLEDNLLLLICLLMRHWENEAADRWRKFICAFPNVHFFRLGFSFPISNELDRRPILQKKKIKEKHLEKRGEEHEAKAIFSRLSLAYRDWNRLKDVSDRSTRLSGWRVVARRRRNIRHLTCRTYFFQTAAFLIVVYWRRRTDKQQSNPISPSYIDNLRDFRVFRHQRQLAICVALLYSDDVE